jgi:hypothetical protein
VPFSPDSSEAAQNQANHVRSLLQGAHNLEEDAFFILKGISNTLN